MEKLSTLGTSNKHPNLHFPLFHWTLAFSFRKETQAKKMQP